jgi:hypothetical protein
MQYQGSGPSARWGAVMATVGSTVVLFGGADWGVQFEETWLWDAQGWHLSSAQGPPWEAADAMAALHGNAIMVGNGQTWQWTGSAWIRRTVPGPSIRGGHRMATLGDKIVLFGGAHDVTQSQTTYYHDTWEWDGNTWTQKSDAGPSGRSGHAMATVGDKILLFGGYGEAGGLSDTWAWDGSSWTQLATTGPLSHYSHGMASIGRKAFIFGGWHGFDLLADTWAWDGAAWTQALAPGPSPRAVPAMVTLP